MNPLYQEAPACRVRCSIEPGLIPSERVARIATADGRIEEVHVSDLLIEGDTIAVAMIGARGDVVLVELPQESASGKWRIWVYRALLEAVQHDPDGS